MMNKEKNQSVLLLVNGVTAWNAQKLLFSAKAKLTPLTNVCKTIAIKMLFVQTGLRFFDML